MEQRGIPVQKIHAGKANMFLSPLFRETLAGVTGAGIELYDTDGSVAVSYTHLDVYKRQISARRGTPLSLRQQR